MGVWSIAYNLFVEFHRQLCLDLVTCSSECLRQTNEVFCGEHFIVIDETLGSILGNLAEAERGFVQIVAVEILLRFLKVGFDRATADRSGRRASRLTQLQSG